MVCLLKIVLKKTERKVISVIFIYILAKEMFLMLKCKILGLCLIVLPCIAALLRIL